MLRWSFLFLVVAIIAAIFGFTGISCGCGRNCQNPVLHIYNLLAGNISIRLNGI